MTTLYEKVGRRYRAVSQREALGGIPEGYWLVHVQPGSCSSRRTVDPDHAAIDLALHTAEDAMLRAMHKACESRPSVRHVPDKDKDRYQRAWEAWVAVVGEVPLCFDGVSMTDVVRAGLAAVRAEAIKAKK